MAKTSQLIPLLLFLVGIVNIEAFLSYPSDVVGRNFQVCDKRKCPVLFSSPVSTSSSASNGADSTDINEVKDDSENVLPEVQQDYEIPEDAVVIIKPNAMKRLRELRKQQKDKALVLRMGVRSGGCSGMSYVMDFSSLDDIDDEDDMVDNYEIENILCVVDSKSMLYLYGLELDYSDKLIGGGFQFFNPNAEESCGCGSSFGV